MADIEYSLFTLAWYESCSSQAGPESMPVWNYETLEQTDRHQSATLQCFGSIYLFSMVYFFIPAKANIPVNKHPYL